MNILLSDMFTRHYKKTREVRIAYSVQRLATRLKFESRQKEFPSKFNIVNREEDVIQEGYEEDGLKTEDGTGR
jgi:hypothetical protein